MKAYRLHLRFSTAKYAFLPLTVLGLLILFNRNRFWIGIWPETGAAITASAFFLSLFTAGVMAWAAARNDVHGLREQAASGAVRLFAVEANMLFANLLWLLAPYGVVASVAFWSTARSSFPAGVGSFFGYAVLGAILIFLSASWGWFVGRLLEPVIAALSAALSWFLLVSVVGELADAAPVSGPPWLALQVDTLAARVAAVLLFAVAVCALPRRSAPRRAHLPGVALSLTALIAVAVTHVSLPALTARAPVSSPLCVQGEIEYCLWPEHEKYVPLIRQVDARVAALPLELDLPSVVMDYSLSGSTRMVDGVMTGLPGDFPPEFDISEGSNWALAMGLATAITSRVLAPCDPTTPDPGGRWNQLHAWLESRLAGGGSRDYTTNAPGDMQQAWGKGYEAAAELDDDEQATWAAALIDARLEQCRAA